MRELVAKGSYKKELKLAHRRGKNIDKLQKLVDKLQRDIPLPEKHRVHKLIGKWNGCMECHIEPDWLLIYRLHDNMLVLEATGTHADLFD